jgi:hypothetical protein
VVGEARPEDEREDADRDRDEQSGAPETPH